MLEKPLISGGDPRLRASAPRPLVDRLKAVVAEPDHAELDAISTVSDCPEGSVLVREGDRFDRIGYLVSGALGMEKRLPDGEAHILGLLVPQDMFGRLFDGPASYDLVALSDTRVLSFDRDRLEAIVSRSVEAENLLIAHILDELDAAREWILLMSGHRFMERVAAFLLVLYRRTLRVTGASGERSQTLRIPIRRKHLARYLGGRQESLSRALHALQEVGAIRLHDAYRVEVTDLAALVRASGADLLAGDGL